MSAATTFAFLVHPRASLSEDLARVFPPLGRVPERVYDVALRRLPVPPVSMASVHLGDDARLVGNVVLVPFGARHLLAHPGQGRDRVAQAVDLAARLGHGVVGLGALTAPVTGSGASLRSREDIGVTNGNAFTAAVVHDQVTQLLPRLRRRRVAVVGATGSVGTTVARLLARDGDLDGLTLIARDCTKTNRLACELRHPATRSVGARIDVRASSALWDAASCDLIVLLTAGAGSILGPEHVGPGGVVLDATQPRNTSPALATKRPDVLVLDGGLVSIPSLRIRGGNIGLPDGVAYACFAETALLALSGHRGHFAIGVPTLHQVDRVRAMATAHADLGFTAAEPTSFGTPVADTVPADAPDTAVAP